MIMEKFVQILAITFFISCPCAQDLDLVVPNLAYDEKTTTQMTGNIEGILYHVDAAGNKTMVSQKEGYYLEKIDQLKLDKNSILAVAHWRDQGKGAYLLMEAYVVDSDGYRGIPIPAQAAQALAYGEAQFEPGGSLNLSYSLTPIFQNPQGIRQRFQLQFEKESFKLVSRELDPPSSSLDHFNLAEYLRLEGANKLAMEHFSRGFLQAEEEKFPMYPELKAQLQLKQAQAQASTGDKEGAKKILVGIERDFQGRFLGDEARKISKSL